LVFTHWEPPTGVGGSTVLEFAKELEERTGGLVVVQPALASTLGPAAEQYDLVARGVADLGGFMPPYTPGRFPLLLSMVELPHKVPGTTRPLTQAYNRSASEGWFDKELGEVKLLWISACPPIQIMLAKGEGRELQNLRGIKIRASGDIWLDVARKLGMVPVAIPITEIYGAMQKRSS